MSNYITALQAVLADSYTLMLKTQNYHWNVEGQNFKGLHELFEEQYRDLFEANDEIAERIRVLGVKVDATYKNFASQTGMKEGDMNLSSADMLKDLFESNRAIVKSMKTAMDAASEAGDEGTVDLMVGRTQTHEKAAWMLRSFLPDSERAALSAPASY